MDETGQNPPLQNQTPESVQSFISSVFGSLQQYGWFILIGLVALFYVKQKFLDPKIQQFTSQREQRNEYKKFDTDEAQARVEAMERARQKLQEKFNEEAAVFAEEQKKKEEEKRLAKVEDWERGYKSKYKPGESSNSTPSTTPSTSSSSKKSDKKLRPNDYNPLMGGASCGYRPTRRGGGG